MTVVTVEVRLTQITGDRLFANERTLDPCKYLDIFIKKIKLVFKKHRHLIWCFSLLFYIYSVISASVLNIVCLLKRSTSLDKFSSLLDYRIFIGSLLET